ncbi:hypothetical protein Pyn_03466 [Prunus yedoensis var. nudiflora]|uniref:Uncharacterized protein n=1 Tax=Prunus yedoensis var. nudiflora TaxID=2094558 RepID=A0A314YH59_PRUYE|nr:hypothetical protein Pyn_03466 [Prunus yedoensis var. nudiflora]
MTKYSFKYYSGGTELYIFDLPWQQVLDLLKLVHDEDDLDEWDERDLDEGDDTRNGEGMYVGDPQGVPGEDPNVKYVQSNWKMEFKINGFNIAS